MSEMSKLELETIEELKLYMQRLIPALENIVFDFRNNQDERGFEVLEQALEGIGWCLEVILLTKTHLEKKGLEIDEFELKNSMNEFENAYKAKDADLLSDVIEFEITDILKSIGEKI